MQAYCYQDRGKQNLILFPSQWNISIRDYNFENAISNMATILTGFHCLKHSHQMRPLEL